MSNSAKNAKSIGLSVAGILVALPADADLASITWVERAIQNQTPIPAGSVITGYASGSYGSYLLAGSTVGGPYSGVSISDIGSQMSPYIPGSQISGYKTWATLYPNVWLATGRAGVLTPFDYILAAPAFAGPFAPVPLRAALTGAAVINVLTSGIFTQNGSTLGSSIGGYETYSENPIVASGAQVWVLAGTTSPQLRSGAAPKWLRVNELGLSIAHYNQYSGTKAPTYVLGSFSNETGATAVWHETSYLGTAIGTVNGSQVKIEQTATAAELQAKTGTIYFPVVQDGKIYGVTLNDFYILMNAQF